MLPYTYKEISYTSGLENLENPDWPGWQDVKYIADFVPGGRLYPTIFNKEENKDAKSWFDISQFYFNSNRFEFALRYVFSNLRWLNASKGFMPGVGEDMADFLDDKDNYIDGKLYINGKSLYERTINLFLNKNGICKTFDIWCDKINKLFHTNCYMLLAYDNNTKKLYAINRPTHILTEEEAINYIHELDTRIPNVIVRNGQYEIVPDSDFEIIFFRDHKCRLA